MRPPVTLAGSQTSVCGDEKVSQMPSGGWSDFDTRPMTQSHPPHTQMGNISSQTASGQTTSFDFSFYFLIFLEGCLTKQMGCSVEQIMQHLIMRGGQRPVEVYLGHCHRKLINPWLDQSLKGELMAIMVCAYNTGGFAFVIE